MNQQLDVNIYELEAAELSMEVRMIRAGFTFKQ